MQKMLMVSICCALTLGWVSLPAQANPFLWPEGKRAAVSLSFDDARTSQIDVAIPLLNRYCIKATFYVLPWAVKSRLADWRQVVAAGHEIGNHTWSHPVSVNVAGTGSDVLEDYTLGRVADDLDAASSALEEMLGVSPVSFAYPSGQKFVGRAEGVQSYVPLVARRFLSGRGSRDAVANDPAFCDLAQITGMTLDDMDFARVRQFVDDAVEKGTWLVLYGHEVGGEGRQTVRSDTLAALCEYITDPGRQVWVAPVGEIASYVRTHRKAASGVRQVELKQPVRVVVCLCTVFGVAFLSFIGATIFRRWTSPAIARLVLLLGASLLLAAAIWSVRYGYAGKWGIVCLLATVGFCLGCWIASMQHVPPRRGEQMSPR